MKYTSVLKFDIEKKKFNHGYLLAGESETSKEMAFQSARILLEHNNLKNHPDFFFQKFELFGIKDSRDLILRAFQKPLLGKNKVFIIEVFSFSIESANALLKLFEEPFEGTYFFVIVPLLETVIPTLRSRLVIIDNSKAKKELEEKKKKFYKIHSLCYNKYNNDKVLGQTVWN